MADNDLQMLAPTPANKTNLEIINDCDSYPYYDTDPQSYAAHVGTYFHLYIPPCNLPVGYLLPSVALLMDGVKGWTLDEDERTLTLNEPAFNSEEEKQEADAAASERARSAVLENTINAWRELNHFAVLRKWRDELYPIYYRDPLTRQKTLLASMERSASPLFGIVTYGVHLTAYTRSHPSLAEKAKINGPSKWDFGIWVGRRASTKQTYAGLLDQTVAGGISTGEPASLALERECEEEALLKPELVKRKAVPAGTVSYIHIRDERAGGETRLLQPECQFVYDLDLTDEKIDGKEVEPESGDKNEVERFELMYVEEAQAALARGDFKPNCAVVLLDFFIRHGILTHENEQDYCEIASRLHRRLEFPFL